MASDVEAAKAKAAHSAVDAYIRDGMVVGIGSGSTIVHAVHRLAHKIKEEKWNHIVCIPSSFQATQLIVENGLTLGDLSRYPEIDVSIDGADEIDVNLQAIKGGGGCCTQEKVVASCAKQFVIIVDFRKESHVLGQKWRSGVPIEVLPLAYVPVSKKLLALKAAAVHLRLAGSSKAGPVVTDNGNFILDADFGEISDPRDLNNKLTAIPGVVETGLFVDMAVVAYVGQADGSVLVKNKNK